ncbi:hypothetical protein Ac2012v2_001981 [Leucoagaricus gongylophorus]
MPHHAQLAQLVAGPTSSQPKSCPSCRALVLVAEPDVPTATCPNCREPVPLRLSQRRLPSVAQRFPLSATRDPPPPADISKSFPPPLHRPQQLPLHSPPPESHPVIPLFPTPDPLSDVTRIRLRTRATHCLYPGAIFQGTQKSGRNSYDVTVTVVDVDLATSFLCGYLCIRGLTDDWPELTTYFDAEIIGSRYGFLTQNWGASENEDLVHWSRFPAFRNIRHEAKRPRLTIDDRDRGAVFMRWKEKFLVPDHRVQDINGASFAGFYYVCVDFNPTAVPCAAGSSSDSSEEQDHRTGRKQNRTWQASTPRKTRVKRPAPAATMSGFYYHQNSEPYASLLKIYTSHGTDNAPSTITDINSCL